MSLKESLALSPVLARRERSWPLKCSLGDWEGRWNSCAVYRLALWNQIKTDASFCIIPHCRLVIISISNMLYRTFVINTAYRRQNDQTHSLLNDACNIYQMTLSGALACPSVFFLTADTLSVEELFVGPAALASQRRQWTTTKRGLCKSTELSMRRNMFPRRFFLSENITCDALKCFGCVHSKIWVSQKITTSEAV